MNWLLPTLVFLPMFGSLAGYCIGRKSKKARDFFADALTVTEFALLLLLFASALRGEFFRCALPRLLGGLSFESDGFRALYALIAGWMWMMTTVFSRQYLAHYRNRNRYYFFTLMTFGATLGVFLSAELITTFVFFEIMSFTSYVMVVHDENEGAMRSGQTYLAVAVLGGMVMLMGLFLLHSLTGTLRIGELKDACAAVPAAKRARLYTAGGLILFGFGAKAGMFPLHIWLPKAHPVAPAPASALLSGILTKAGIFGVLVLSCKVFLHDPLWGRAVLALGTVTMLLGAVLAVFSVNLKRTLACSSVSQIGFILVGVGMQGLLGEENTLAVWGTLLHMMNHSLLKLVLFMTAGAVYMNLHKLELNDVRGFGRGKPLLMAVYLCGYLGIGGVPLFNGYISKTLLHEGIVEYMELLEEAGRSILVMKSVEWIFLFSGGLTVAYMTKLFVCLFLEKNADPALQAKYDALNGHYVNRESALALGLSALLLPVLGLFPSRFMAGAATLGQGFMNGESPAHPIAWFSLTNLKGAAISLCIGALVYFLYIRRRLMADNGQGDKIYVNRWPVWLDMEDKLYRPLIALLTKLGVAFSAAFADLGDKVFPKIAEKTAELVGRCAAAFAEGLPGVLRALSFSVSGAAASFAEALPRVLRTLSLLVSTAAAELPDALMTLLGKTALRKIPIPAENPAAREKGDMAVPVHLPKGEREVLESFSYGLILFGLGLCGTLLFLLLR